MLFAETMGQLVKNTSFQFRSTVLSVFPFYSVVGMASLLSWSSYLVSSIHKRSGTQS